MEPKHFKRIRFVSQPGTQQRLGEAGEDGLRGQGWQLR